MTCRSIIGAAPQWARVLRAILSAATLVGGVLSACASQGPRPATYRATSEFLTARLTGRLETQGPCVVVVDPTGQVWTIAWPAPGTRWDFSVSPGWINIGNETVSVGDLVSLGGGGSNESNQTPGPNPADQTLEANAAAFWIEPPAQECLKNPIWRASHFSP